MTTAAAIINRASRQLLAGTVEERNKLASSIDSSVTSIVLSYDLGGFRNGSVFEIESELIYVWEADATAKTLEVERGYGGTTPASHSSGVVTTLNPRFPRVGMLDALNSELDDLSSTANGLFRVATVDLTYNGSDRQINLTSSGTIIELLDARLRYLADDYPVIRNVRLQTGLPTTDFASGNSIVFDEPVMAGTIRVRYKAPFVRATNEASDLTTNCFLPATCDDIVETGVMLRMMNAREIKRNFIESQGDTRRPDEVPAGATRDSISNLVRLRRERITAEAGRLKALYPIKFRK
jgi:hypothetical protein